MGLITILMVFWLLMIVVYVMLNRGIWIFTDVTKGFSLFMLEKALGPAIDFAEGRSGSGSVAWIIQGAVWLAISSTLTFIGLWLGHEPNALHSLSAWGLNPTSESLLLAGKLSTIFGAVGMFLIGSALHIVPNLANTNLASEKNATLVSFVWALSVSIMVIGAYRPEIFGVKILLISTVINSLALIAIIVNLLLTASSRERKIAFPGWLIIIGLISFPVSTLTVVITGNITSGTGQWALVRLIGASFFLQLSGVGLYAASFGSGNPLWSRSLTAITLAGSIFTLNPIGFTSGELSAMFLGLDPSLLEPSRNDLIGGSFIMALFAVPLIALASNLIITIRGDDSFIENSDNPGIAEINFGAIMLIPVGISFLFIQTDFLSGNNELMEISSSMHLLALWTVLVPISLGATLCIFPAVSGRNVLSANRSRRAFWMMSGGAFTGIIFTIMGDFSNISLLESNPEAVITETPNALRSLGSVIFYFVVLGSIFQCLNMIRGFYRGSKIVNENSQSSTSISMKSYNLTKTTTVRKLFSKGATMETEIVPVSESEKQGKPTEL